jgi:predicted dehydrogenase
VIVCAASKDSAVTNQALELCRQKGRVSVVGAVGLQLEREALYLKELDFRLSCSYGPGRYQPAYEERGLDYPIGHVRWTEGRNMAEFLRMLASGAVRVQPLISLVRPVAEAKAAYDAVLQGGALAALLSYGAAEEPVAVPPGRSLVLKAPGKEDGVGVAVIGAGSFASAWHLPSLAKIPGVRLEAVCARTGLKAKQAGEKFGARYCTTDFGEVLRDSRVNAVVIATRHHLHAEMCIAAAAAGKHVFVEKPIALSIEDAEAVCAAVERAGVLLSVGFNRRFSPHSVAIKEALCGVPGPRMILYRCNAGALPPGHWAIDPVEGGGRIRGEAVHFYDWCCWLTGAEVAGISAARIDSGSIKAPAEDNLSTTLRFRDGSLATVVYTSLGHGGPGKERIEVFAGGGVAVLEDFRSTTFHGLRGKDLRTRTEEKGQFGVLENFIAAVRGAATLGVNGADGARATRIACAALAAAAGTQA